jgi:outer membrane protein assembly factor BamD (BamD/ComL family)
MSIAGIASSLFSQINNLQNSQQTTAQAEFQQLAQDLQAGNLTQAQTDFAALQQNAPASQASGSSALSQAFSTLGKDLQSGNLTAAQQEFATIQQDFQQGAQQGSQVHHHHHYAQEPQNSSPSSSQQTNSITQLFNTLGQDLQSGNLTNAQQAYASLQQDLQLFSAGGASLAASAPFQVNA